VTLDYDQMRGMDSVESGCSELLDCSHAPARKPPRRNAPLPRWMRPDALRPDRRIRIRSMADRGRREATRSTAAPDVITKSSLAQRICGMAAGHRGAGSPNTRTLHQIACANDDS